MAVVSGGGQCTATAAAQWFRSSLGGWRPETRMDTGFSGEAPICTKSTDYPALASTPSKPRALGVPPSALISVVYSAVLTLPRPVAAAPTRGQVQQVEITASAAESCGTCRSPPRRSRNASSKRAASPTWPTWRRLHPTCRSARRPATRPRPDLHPRVGDHQPALFWEPTVGIRRRRVRRQDAGFRLRPRRPLSASVLRGLRARSTATNTLAGASTLVTRPSGEFGGSAARGRRLQRRDGQGFLDLPKLRTGAAVGYPNRNATAGSERRPAVRSANSTIATPGRARCAQPRPRPATCRWTTATTRAVPTRTRVSRRWCVRPCGDFGFRASSSPRAADHGQHRQAVVRTTGLEGAFAGRRVEAR